MRSIISVLIVLALSLPGAAQQPAQKAKTKEKTPAYYPLKVGTKWHYSVDSGNGQKVNVVIQIAKIETIDGKGLARLESVVNGEVKATEHVGVETGGIFRYRFNGVEFTPPLCLLKYPVKDGDTWETETKIGAQQITVSGKEASQRNLEVPAGKFDTISSKIENTVGGNKISTTYWFAPEVGIVRQLVNMPDRSVNMELVKFEEGK